MEGTDQSEEPEKKRPHLSSPLSPSSNSPTSNDTVDIAVLQFQNRNLVQQLESQKSKISDLEAKIQELNDKQISYDNTLITANRLWNQLVDDLILFGLLAGRRDDILQSLDHTDYSGGSVPSCPPEDVFLCRLLGVDSLQSTGDDEIVGYSEQALASRHSSTLKLMKIIEDVMIAQRAKTESFAQALQGSPSIEDAIILLTRMDAMMKDEIKYLEAVIDALHSKHKEYVDEIQAYINSHLEDESEIKRLSGDLEETLAELEESRRKLINLKMEKDAAAGIHFPAPSVVNGNLSPEKPTDRSLDLRELRESVEENKILAADRLSELEEQRDEHQLLLKELEDLKSAVKDDKHIHSSRLYNLVKDQLQHWHSEVDRYKALARSLQVERSFLMRREKEVHAKLESADSARNSFEPAEYKLEELELQLQNCINEKNDLEIKMVEAVEDSGREDIKSEFRVMALALSKEMAMMEAQLNQWKQVAQQSHSLRAQSQSLKPSLNQKTDELKCVSGKCAEQVLEIKHLKHEIERMEKENLEVELMLNMYGQEVYDNRGLQEIQESESRARSQAEVLKGALEEHSLELRVKAAYEAEAANKQRLSAAEAEIADLMAQLDASERDVLEVKEAIKLKDKEAEAYISEIETIGQAYEDMQTQNQHLLQLVTERDNYNIKLVSESVKTKQAQSNLHSENQALAKQLQDINASVESLKTRLSHSEEQMKGVIAEGIKSAEEDMHLAIQLENAQRELTDAEKESKWLKYAVTSSEKEYEQIQKKIEEMQTDLENESERINLEEELMELNKKVAELSSESGEVVVQRLQDEINKCKNMLKCSVCSDRPKEVVIVKCYHLFCNQCIQRNLEIRHRKCPACGTAFGQNDVRFVKIC